VVPDHRGILQKSTEISMRDKQMCACVKFKLALSLQATNVSNAWETKKANDIPAIVLIAVKMEDFLPLNAEQP
jgi:hypothetical protein